MNIVRSSQNQRPFQLPLSLWKQVVFVDWNGVLNKDMFWSSVRTNPKHPFYAHLRDACERLFNYEKDLVHSWMRGEIESKEIVQKLDIELDDRRFGDDFLLRRLHEDCRKMGCENSIIEELNKVRRDNFVVLATDNMDCFLSEISYITKLAATVDYVLCSSSVGILKCEDIERFFMPWLRLHGLTFSQALLLDDSEINCSRFRKMGGSAVVVKTLKDAITGLRKWQKHQAY